MTSSVIRRRTGRARPIWVAGLLVSVGAAVATAHGLFEVALACGVPEPIAWLYPLITDGLALVAYASTTRLRARGYAWTVVVLAAGLSGTAQACFLAGGGVEVAPAGLRFGVGAWPAIAAAVTAHLLYLLSRADQPDDVHGQTYSPHDPEVVQRDVRTLELNVQPSGTAASPERATDHRNQSIRPRSSRSLDTSYGSRPGERARTAALGHRERHGDFPTVSALEELAGVSRGTAAAALRDLRTRQNGRPDATDPSDRRPNT